MDLISSNSVDEKILNFSSALNKIDEHFNAVKAQNIITKQQLNNLNDGKFNLEFDEDFSYSTNDLSDIEGIINEAKEFLEISASATATASASSDLAEGQLVDIPNAVKIRTAAQSAADTAASAAATASGVAQEDTISISGTIEVGDTYGVTINSKTFNVEIDTQKTLDDVVDNLISKINDPGNGSLSVVASAGENVGQILLTAESAGVAFKATALAVNVDSGIADNTATITTTTSSSGGATQVAQIDSMTLAGTAEVGDVYGVNINDQFKITYSVQSGDTITTIRNELLNLINSNEDVSEILVASEGDDQSQITLTAKIAGNGFSAEAIVENVDAGINDNQINISTITQNLLGADELAAEAENEAVSAAEIITQQINAIKIKKS